MFIAYFKISINSINYGNNLIQKLKKTQISTSEKTTLNKILCISIAMQYNNLFLANMNYNND